MCKNVQSIRNISRLQAFDFELDSITFDVLCVSETWRESDQEIFDSTSGHRFYLSGGADDVHKGVGIIIHARRLDCFSDISFQVVSPRLCFIDCLFSDKRWRIISAYMSNDRALNAELHDYISLLLQGAREVKRLTIIAGDFNASIGELNASEDESLIGKYECGIRINEAQI
jgi:hypothetical protein